jgi:hypothetical protein
MFARPEPCPAQHIGPQRQTELFPGPALHPDPGSEQGFAPVIKPPAAGCGLFWQASGHENGKPPGSGKTAQAPESGGSCRQPRSGMPHSRPSYDGWYTGAQGALALAAQQKLLGRMLAPWINNCAGRR